MEDKIKIGNRIKFLRENEKMTQKDLAIKLGLKGETAVANYEAGYSIPKDEVKLKMCEIFNCSLDYLMCKSDIRNPEINADEIDIAFATGIKGLNEENKEIAKNIIAGLLAKQKDDDKEEKKDKKK